MADRDSPVRTVHFHGAAERWDQKVLGLSEGRWRRGLPADVTVFAAGDDIASDAAGLILVIDARSSPSSVEIAGAFRAGVDGYVCTDDAVLVLAHLDALARSPDRWQ